MTLPHEITQEHVLAGMRAMIEGTPDAIFVKDAQGRYQIINAAGAQLVGKRPEEIIGKDDSQLFAFDTARTIVETDRRVLQSGESETREVVFTVAEIPRAFEATQGVYRDPNGKVLGVFGIARDISERKEVEVALRESQERFKNFMDNGPAIAWMKNEEGKYVYVNSRFEQRFGMKPEDLYGRTDFDVWPSDVAHSFRAGDHAVLNAGTTEEFMETAPDPDGSTHYWQVFKFPFRDSAGNRYVGGMAVDITEQRMARETLKEYADRLKALSGRLLEVQEQERRYLARELHDEIGQILTGLQLSLEASTRVDGTGAAQYLTEAQGLVKDLASRIRDLSLRLRPTMLDDLGLLPALLWLFDNYTARTQIRVAFQHSGMVKRLGLAVETAAYRIVQEALTNVARHAGVSEVAVCAWALEDQVHLQIEDSGSGFDFAAEQAKNYSTGLSGMQERAALLGGRLTVESSPAGTRIIAVLPIGEAAEGGGR